MSLIVYGDRIIHLCSLNQCENVFRTDWHGKHCDLGGLIQ